MRIYFRPLFLQWQVYYNVAMQKDKIDQALCYQAYVQNNKRRTDMRNRNFQQRDQDLFLGQRRNAQIKLIQKFIGKLKMDNKNFQSIFSEMDTLNMSKYIEEVSSIIVTCLSEKQIPFYAEIATRLNMSYENVPSILIKDLCKAFNQCVQSQQDNKVKIKSLFLFAVELFVCGFSFSYKEIIEMIKKVFKCGKNKRNSSSSQAENKLFIYCYSSTIFSTFLAHFSEIFTKRQPEWNQTWKNEEKQLYKYPQVLPLKTKQELTSFFSKYVIECHGVLKDIVELIKKYEAELFQCLRMDGQFNKQTEKSYVQMVEKFIITKKHLKFISSALSQKIQTDQLNTKITTIPQIMARYIDKAENAIIFQDQFQRQIYENILEIVTSEQKNTTEEQYKQFKQLLDTCKNVNDSNQICKAFNMINNKKNRKNLAKDVLQYRKQYHLVTPYLCRVIAIISLHYKDIGETVNDLIFSEYEKIKDSQSATFVSNDKKSRIMKYICEFTKFKVIDADKTMNCIQNLIDNLNGYNIQLIVSVLENVGRFLHLSENSANRFTFLMKKYQNIIKKKSLPILTTSQLINSINMLKPRKEMEKQQQRQKTAEQLQAEKIMNICVINNIDDLMNEIDEIIKTEEGYNAIKVAFLKKIQNFDFMNSYNYAYLLQELKYNKLSDFIVERTIQNLLLYISNGENQKTILWSKFLAQLFNYKIIERSLLFSTIESLLKVVNNQIGVIHTVCYIFEACSGYLDSKKVNKKNQKFLLLVKFKHFLFKCQYIPMLEQYEIIELFDQYQSDLTEINKKVLEEFMQFTENKMKVENRELSYSEELDKYLSRKNLKKYEEKIQNKDTRGQGQSPEKIIKVQNQQINIVQESRLFDKQLTSIMQENRKDYSSRIAKPMYLQKNFEKKKQKKKNGPCITIIGRSGNKFIKKDISKKEQQKRQ